MNQINSESYFEFEVERDDSEEEINKMVLEAVFENIVWDYEVIDSLT